MFLTATGWGCVFGVALYTTFFVLSRFTTPHVEGLKRHYAALSCGGRADWDSRVSSSAHAIVVVLGVYNAALVHPPHLDLRVLYWDDRLFVPYGITGLGPEFWMGLFVGYLIADVPIVIQHWNEIEMPVLTLFHHGLCASCYVLSLNCHTMQWYGCFWLLAELSTPLANLRWWLFQCRVGSSSALYLFVGSWLFVTFFMARVLPLIIIPFLLYKDGELIRHRNGTFVLVWFSCALLSNALLQCYWWSLMLRAILRKCFGIGGRLTDMEEMIDDNDDETPQEPASVVPQAEPGARLRHSSAAQQSPLRGETGETGGDPEANSQRPPTYREEEHF